MQSKYRTAFIGGLIGSVAVAAALGLLVLLGQIPKTPFVASWQSVAGGGWLAATIIGGILFLLIGALWAVPFPAIFSRPTVLKGILWGLVPTLWALTFVPAALLGKPMFAGGAPKGIIVPIVMNCLIWGSIVGWWGRRRLAASPDAAGHGHT
jgi:hypothetical protein